MSINHSDSKEKKNKMGSTLKRGSAAIESAIKASSRSRGKGSDLPWFAPEVGKTYVIRSLTKISEVVSVKQHRIWMKEAVNGRNLVQFTCYGDDKCPGCKYGDKAKYRGYIVLYDHNEGKKGTPTKIWGAGIRVMEALYALEKKYKDITRFTIDVRRKGEGLDTEYTLLPNPASKPTAEEIAAMKKPPFDLEELLQPPANRKEISDVLFAKNERDDDEDAEEEEDEELDDTIEDEEDEDEDDTVDVDDDDEDSDEDDDSEFEDDDEEDEKPAKKSVKKKAQKPEKKLKKKSSKKR